MAKDKPAPTRSNVDPPHVKHPNVEEEIRARAFQMYEEHGCQDGHDLEDWLRAEADVTNGLAKAKGV